MVKHKINRVREHGQGLMEYTFLMILVTLVVLAVLLLFGPQVGNAFSMITHGL